MNGLLGIQSLATRLLPLTARQLPKLVRTGASLTAPSTVQQVNEEDLPEHTQEKAIDRRRLPLRSGLIALKRGMGPWFDQETGETFPVTVLEVNQVEVIYNKTKQLEGYYAVQVGYGSKNPNKVPRQLLGHFEKAQVNPKSKVAEFMVKSEEGLLPVGTELKADHFTPGQFVDLKGVSKGKGFAGVIKRYGMKGQSASHGTSLAHRSGGSYGANTTPGRVIPGQRMPGRMGGKNCTKQNSLVVDVDAENGIIYVKGHVPGPKNSFVKVSDAIKKL
jgi:large subunit ribosomal protein L3